MKPHKHAELIKAWADGAKIQYWTGVDWFDCINNEPSWNDENKFRIKPEPKPDLVMYSRVLSMQKHKDGGYYAWVSNAYTQMPSCKNDNLKLTFDGETGELKSSEVLK